MSWKHTVETASTTVEICDLSPHSAINVKTKAFKKTGLMKIVKNFSVFFKQLKLSSSSWITGSSLSGEVRLLVVLISLTCAIGSVSLGEFEFRTISTTICGLSTSFKSVVEFLRKRTRNSSSSSLKITWNQVRALEQGCKIYICKSSQDWGDFKTNSKFLGSGGIHPVVLFWNHLIFLRFGWGRVVSKPPWIFKGWFLGKARKLRGSTEVRWLGWGD